MKPRLALLLCAAGAILSCPPAATAQQPVGKPDAAARPAQEKEPPAPETRVPLDAAKAITIDPAVLQAKIAKLPPPRLRVLLNGWMALVRAQQAVVEKALAAAEGSDERKQAESASADRDALIARAEIVIAALAKSEPGADVRGYRAVIKRIREAEAAQVLETTTVPEDPAKARGLSLAVLEAQLRPLTKAQVKGQLDEWMSLLQQKAFEVRASEVAGLNARGDEKSRHTSHAVELRAQRDALIARVKTVVDAYAAKAGDEKLVKEARAYLSSIVVAPPIDGLQAGWVTLRAWLTSPEGGVALGLAIVRFLLILFGFLILARVLSRVVSRALGAMRRSSQLLRSFFANSVRKVTMFIGIVVALGEIGVDIGPLLAAIGAAGFVIGFALQGTLSNFAAGVMIMIYRPYDIGDVVDVGGTVGTVADMTLVSTTIKTGDNQTIIVPNNSIWGGVITNITANETRRVDMTFGIGYQDDAGQARALLTEIVRSHPKVLDDPEPTIRLNELADSAVNFIVRPWAKTSDYWEVYWDVTQAVKERFDAAGISIPFPQHEVHVHQVTAPGVSPSS